MSKLLRRHLLALMLGITGLSLAMPLTHNAAAYAENGGSDDGATSDNDSASVGDNESDDGGIENESGEDEDDDDAGPVGGAPKGSFQEGCALTDLQCLNAPVR